MLLSPGEPILNDKYVVESFLGQGAFAEVYRVLHCELKALRAVKVVSQEIAGVGRTIYDDFRGRFRLEAQLGAGLNHPHVIQVHDFEETEGRLYLVMEYAAGDSPYGCADMAGNVWEWCADWYDERYYAHSPAQDPPGPARGLHRVLRGGAWTDAPWWVRAAYRGGCEPSLRNVDLGFRCAVPARG